MARLRLLVCCLALALPPWTGADPTDKETDGVPKITEMSVVSRIASRYARSTINSWVLNPAATAKEVTFNVQLPEFAFISAFSMTVRNKTYPGIVKEKQKAKQEYSEAVNLGWSAGLVATKERDANKFTVSVNVGAGSRALFTLSYEELLQRKLSWYEHAVSVRPQQTVENLTVEVVIDEKAGLSRLAVPHLRTSNLITDDVNAQGASPPGTTVTQTPTSAVVRFQPSVEQQRELAKDGVLGDFIVRYDVERPEQAGEVEIINGYFAHFFAPKQLNAMPKNIVFVIDVSGSMSGTKMRQTKEAMLKILDDLRPKDHFNIVTFSYGTKTWMEKGLVKASADNILSAKTFINAMVADGGTNIHDALSTAVSLLKYHEASKEVSVPLVILLTDGQPTVGETSEEVIISKARAMIGGLYSLYCLGFGEDVMFDFLEKLALPNSGFARKIFEDVDATLQLKGFYDEVGTPLLSQVVVEYSGNEVAELTQTSFANYFSGSEIVVAGRVRGDAGTLVATVRGHDEKGTARMVTECVIPPFWPPVRPAPGPAPPKAVSYTERLWAFLTIKQLLKAKVLATDDRDGQRIDNETLALSLKYGFVTPLTSMVVTVPDKEKPEAVARAKSTAEVAAEAEEDDEPEDLQAVLSIPLGRGRTRQQMSGVQSFNTPVQYGTRRGMPGMSGFPPGAALRPSAPARGRLYDSPAMGPMAQGPPPPPQAGGMLRFFDRLTTDKPFNQATIHPSTSMTSRGSIKAVQPPTALRFPSEDITLCFSPHGSDGEILTLLDDPVTGLSLKATVGSRRRSNSQSYSEVSIHVPTGLDGEDKLEIVVTSSGLHLNRPGHPDSDLQTDSSSQFGSVTVQVVARKAVVVSVANGPELRVLFSGSRRHRNIFLYVMDPRGLSTETTGLLGGILHKDVKVLPPSSTAHPGLSAHLTPRISIGSKTLNVLSKDMDPATSALPMTCYQTDFAVLDP